MTELTVSVYVIMQWIIDGRYGEDPYPIRAAAFDARLARGARHAAAAGGVQRPEQADGGRCRLADANDRLAGDRPNRISPADLRCALPNAAPAALTPLPAATHIASHTVAHTATT